MTKTILLIEPDKAMQANIVEALNELGRVIVQPSAAKAVSWAHDSVCDVVVMELSLGGHSGFEFLYEFRTYKDWENIPILVYSGLKLDVSICNSRAWEKLKIAAFLYKPQTSLAELKAKIEESLKR